MLWQLLFSVWIASEVALAIFTRTRRGGGEIKDNGTMPLLWLVIVASITACEWLSHYVGRSFPAWFKDASVVLLAVGLAVRAVSILSLGRAFSPNVAIQPDQRINRRGPYRFVRHPSYTGLLIIFLAIGLHRRNPLSLACAFLPTTAALLYRIRIEEQALRSAFGTEYEQYANQTSRLLPGLY